MLEKNTVWQEKKNQMVTVSYENILANPGKGEIVINSPKSCKRYAEWRDKQCQVWDSTKERYFDVWFCTISEPSARQLAKVHQN